MMTEVGGFAGAGAGVEGPARTGPGGQGPAKRGGQGPARRGPAKRGPGGQGLAVTCLFCQTRVMGCTRTQLDRSDALTF